MAAFSTYRARFTGLAVWASLIVAGCASPQAPEEASEAISGSPRVASPVDPGLDGTSRNLLQHFRARELAGGRMQIPAGDRLQAESTAWRLPFQSKRMVAALLSTAARDRIEDLPFVLADNATFGGPDSRRPHERPIFDPRYTERFFAGFRGAAQRFDEHAHYSNPTSFLMGLQERIRTGAEPMWAFYQSGPDRLLFRFRVYGDQATIDYVGFFAEAPSEPVDYSALGPAPSMTPGVRREDGRIMHNFNPKKDAVKRTLDGTPPAGRTAQRRPSAARQPQ